ncbi:THAP domain-containing protein 5-like [Cydia strobilella]|uniref:THAP domain-containing protein 5-like n=1 Tax=Cydia strobilella TaxID=1100964 RepID=UPI003004B647
MPSCVLKSCSNSTKKHNASNGITFHRFLRPGHEKSEYWIRFVQKNRNEETWLPNQYTYICSVHFREQDKYISKSGRGFLKECAVPYNPQNDPPPGPSKQEETSDPISVSDSESIFDSPHEIVLKEKLQKEIIARKNLANKCRALKEQNRYLKKKCLSYKEEVEALKQKLGKS